MPITTDNFGNPLAIFGFGDIAPGVGDCELRLMQLSVPYRIGDNDNLADDPDVIEAAKKRGPFMRLCFADPASISVVIECLCQVQRKMLAGSDTVFSSAPADVQTTPSDDNQTPEA